jgi:hypothetical protein
VTFALSFALGLFAFAGRFAFAFAFGRFEFALAFGRFAFVLPLAFVFPFAFSFLFFGFLGLFSSADVFVLRFSLGSSGVTVSGDSPSLAGRLMSIATV